MSIDKKMQTCPYCDSTNIYMNSGHPYPYAREDKSIDLKQMIFRYRCECDKIFFLQTRIFKGRVDTQQYKQGMYQYPGF